jgi:hypothetical protein
MLTLDAEDYEILGWGSERRYEASAAIVSKAEAVVLNLRTLKKNPESKKRNDKNYRRTKKGKEATARAMKKRASTTYYADYYEANRERIKARVKKWQQNMSEGQRAKRAEYDKQRYERKKAERERATEAVQGIGRGVRQAGGDQQQAQTRLSSRGEASRTP